MHTFTVWAPNATSVALELETDTLPMQRDERGWWSLPVPAAGHGTRYAFLLDDARKALPDPRSPYQPAGVHGPSCVVDHSCYRWTDDNWQPPPLASAILYELHIGTFTPEGTFTAAIDRLDHLVSFGVTHIELMPVNEFSGGWGWGYDGVDLFAPHHAYGAPDDLKRLVDAAHARGLAVLLDVVYNHLGPAGNYLNRFGPYFTSRHRTPWGEAVNLDGPQSHEVRRFLCDNAAMWLRDYHFDGLRVDAVHALVDDSPMHFLEQLTTEVDDLSRRMERLFVLIAESDLNDPRMVQARATGGFGFDAQWSDDFHHSLHALLTTENAGYYADFGQIGQLAKALRHVFVYDGCYSHYRRRRHGRPVNGLPKYRFLGYIQNHDQVGNRRLGERIAQLAGLRGAKIAAGIVLTSPFVPMLFQGEEWACSSPFQYFTQHEDVGLGKAVSEGRRSEFADFAWDPEAVPDPQDRATFVRSRLDWSETARAPHAEMLDWYRRLIRLRRAHPELSAADPACVETQFDEDKKWLVIYRGAISVCCNFSPDPQCVPLEGDGDILLHSTREAARNECGVRLGSETLAVVGPPTDR